MLSFRYKEVSQRLVAELSKMLVRGESAVLLSPRFIGKRYTISHVRNRILKDPSAGPIVDMRWLTDQRVDTRDKAIRIVNEAVERAASRIGLVVTDGDELFDTLDDLQMQAGKRVVLLAANVDAMGHHLARAFLQGIQERVEADRLAVLLGGEEDFRDMVRGPSSEFRCANLFVLQRFARDEFDLFLQRYITKGMRIQFDDLEAACEYFFALTGGHTYLLRRVLWQLTENLALEGQQSTDVISVEAIGSFLEPNEIGSVRYSEPLRFADGIIAREPECWGSLEKLMREGAIELDLTGNQPATLELAGVAVHSDGQLRFSSKLMEDFIRRHYDDRRFGDLHARRGQWSKAFKRYSLLPNESFLRSTRAEDRLDMELTVEALCTELQSAATRSSVDVMELFESGCRYLLALRLGRFHRPPYSKSWQTNPETAASISGPVLGIGQALNGIDVEPPARTPLAGPWDDYTKRIVHSADQATVPLGEPWNDYAVAVYLPAFRTDELNAVVVGNLDGAHTISREQRRLVTILLRHFAEAYSFAVSTERNSLRLWVREQHEQTVNSIFKSLGIRVLDVGQALALAAIGLRYLGYRRVLFCLLDSKGERIQGVLDDSDDDTVNVADMTDYDLLVVPSEDLQSDVAVNGHFRVVPDANVEPLANQIVVEKARMKGLAIVPILNGQGHVLGTIHVEREDGIAPSEEEVEDLLAFGRRLATVIENSQRVNLLQSAIDQGPDPVVVVDPRNHVRYANKPAAELFGLSVGWYDDTESLPSADAALAEGSTLLQLAQEEGLRQFRHLPCIAERSNTGAAVLADVIADWRGDKAGAFVHVNYLRDLQGVLDACRVIAKAHDTDSAMQSILDAIKSLGHKWGRLYLLSDGDSPRLVGRRAFGLDDDASVEEEFKSGKVVLLSQDEATTETWLCIETGEPCVFGWKDAFPPHAIFNTMNGLSVLNVPNPKCPERICKRPGDFWVDLPVVVSGRALGKITFQCDEDMLQEHFELLRVLARLVSILLQAFEASDRAFRERENYIARDVAEKTLATAAHNINTRIQGLSAMYARYRLLEADYEPVKSLNVDFHHVLKETMGTIKNIKKRLAPVSLDTKRLNLAELAKQALAPALPQDTWELTADPSLPEIYADAHLLEMALLELVDNSVQAVGSREDIRLKLYLWEELVADRAMIRVRLTNNGPVVPIELKERIFDDFFSHRPGGKTGLGLGLGFVRRVLRAHGGTIRECGQPGTGAEFVIEIPISNTLEQNESERVHVQDSDC